MPLDVLSTRRPVLVAFLAAVTACGGGSSQGASAGANVDAEPEAAVRGAEAVDTVYVVLNSAQDIEDFFADLDYTPQAWAEGVREIPRMYTTGITARWKERTQSELDVQAKKRIFFRAMAPLALRSNELIRGQRERLESMVGATSLSDDDRAFLTEIGEDYGVEIPPDDAGPEAWARAREEVFLRVDEVPVSLVLAQSANESGWGTSRFATTGNALFGQWSFGGSGMLPEKQRESLGDYRVAAFETPLLSVAAYMRNLNSHSAYARLRQERAAMRAADQPLDGWALAGTLDRYSERGQDYVDELREMIDYNRLRETDVTFLAGGPVYLLVLPEGVPEGAAVWTPPVS